MRFVTASWKRAFVAVRPDVELQRLQLDARGVGHVLEVQRREIRLTCLRTETGELRNPHPDRVVAIRVRVRKGLETFFRRSSRGLTRHVFVFRFERVEATGAAVAFGLVFTLHYGRRGGHAGLLTARPPRGHPLRLSKIKLSGFKTFVDSTTIKFPSNLMGIVGPNGCGKSNIIDAIRWVLGEGVRQDAARRLDGRRHLQRLLEPQARRRREHRAHVRQLRRHDHGRIRRLQRSSRSPRRFRATARRSTT